MVFDILWEGPNKFYPISPILQDPQPPVVAIGNSATEAVAAWMAQALDNPAAEPTLVAFQMGQIFNFLRDPEDFAAEVQATSFGPSSSARQWVVTRPTQEQGDPPIGGADVPLDPEQTALLIELNSRQIQLDAARKVLATQQQELFADGWKQAFVDPRDRTLRQQIDNAVTTLIGQVKDQFALVAEREALVEAARLQLVAAVEPDFTVAYVDQIRLNQPVDPVIMVAGAGLDTKLQTPGALGVDGRLFTRFTGQNIDGLEVSFPIDGQTRTTLLTAAQFDRPPAHLEFAHTRVHRRRSGSRRRRGVFRFEVIGFLGHR